MSAVPAQTLAGSVHSNYSWPSALRVFLETGDMKVLLLGPTVSH